MASELPATNGAHDTQINGNGKNQPATSFAVKAGLARMLKGGVIMDVVNAEQVSQVFIHECIHLATRNVPSDSLD